jgi:hypothetical protein
MGSFAVMLRSKPTIRESILLMVDERRDAEEIAVELRRKGHQVDVCEVTMPLTADGPWLSSPAGQ